MMVLLFKIPLLPLGEGAKRQRDSAQPQENAEGAKIRLNFDPHPARLIKARRPLPEGEGLPIHNITRSLVTSGILTL